MDVGYSYGGWHLVAHGARSVGLQPEGTKESIPVGLGVRPERSNA